MSEIRGAIRRKCNNEEQYFKVNKGIQNLGELME
jgi:hypothetical protein